MTISTRKKRKEIWKSIRVRANTYKELMASKGYFEMQLGRVVSLDETVKIILESAPKTPVAIAVEEGK